MITIAMDRRSNAYHRRAHATRAHRSSCLLRNSGKRGGDPRSRLCPPWRKERDPGYPRLANGVGTLRYARQSLQSWHPLPEGKVSTFPINVHIGTDKRALLRRSGWANIANAMPTHRSLIPLTSSNAVSATRQMSIRGKANGLTARIAAGTAGCRPELAAAGHVLP